MKEQHKRIKNYIQTMSNNQWEEFFEYLEKIEEILREEEIEAYSGYVETKNMDQRNKKAREAMQKYAYTNGIHCLFSCMLQWLSGNFSPLF